MTVSCYQADAQGLACGRCDSCRLRAAGLPPPAWRIVPLRLSATRVCQVGLHLGARIGEFGYHEPVLGTVAQLVEQGPFKALVLGSSPSRPIYIL